MPYEIEAAVAADAVLPCFCDMDLAEFAALDRTLLEDLIDRLTQSVLKPLSAVGGSSGS
jgi:hypothetical protein